MSAFRFDG